jgi:hypothetical protein
MLHMYSCEPVNEFVLLHIMRSLSSLGFDDLADRSTIARLTTCSQVYKAEGAVKLSRVYLFLLTVCKSHVRCVVRWYRGTCLPKSMTASRARASASAKLQPPVALDTTRTTSRQTDASLDSAKRKFVIWSLRHRSGSLASKSGVKESQESRHADHALRRTLPMSFRTIWMQVCEAHDHLGASTVAFVYYSLIIAIVVSLLLYITYFKSFSTLDSSRHTIIDRHIPDTNIEEADFQPIKQCAIHS